MDSLVTELLFQFTLFTIFSIGFFILLRNFLENHHKVILFLTLFMLTGMLECGLRGIEVSIEIRYDIWAGWWYMVAKWTLCFRALIVIAVAESMGRETIRKGYLIIWAILSTIVILLDIIWMMLVNIDPYVNYVLDKPSDWAYFLLTFAGVLGIRIAFKILLAAPDQLKKNARLFFLGFLIAGISFPLFEIDRIIDGAPTRTICGITLGLGVLILTTSLIKSPQLAFILPFKIYRLTVMENVSGVALYTHTWSAGKSFVDEDLFSGMLQGIRSLIQESMNTGDLREIITDTAVLIIKKQETSPVTMILATTKTSQSIRTAFEAFFTEFNADFASYFNNRGNVEQYRQADAIIQKIFVFVPK